MSKAFYPGNPILAPTITTTIRPTHCLPNLKELRHPCGGMRPCRRSCAGSKQDERAPRVVEVVSWAAGQWRSFGECRLSVWQEAAARKIDRRMRYLTRAPGTARSWVDPRQQQGTEPSSFLRRDGDLCQGGWRACARSTLVGVDEADFVPTQDQLAVAGGAGRS